MKTATFEVPTMYGDHHVIEVRRIMLEIPGVKDVYASSCFGVVEVTIDEKLVNESDIVKKLEEAGYLGEWTLPVELGVPAPQDERAGSFFRHTAVYETTRQTISFAQKVMNDGRPLWPCPGMGLIQRVEEA